VFDPPLVMSLVLEAFQVPTGLLSRRRDASSRAAFFLPLAGVSTRMEQLAHRGNALQSGNSLDPPA
jgi:hypothetical protein